MITAVYAALLGLFFIYLSMSVIGLRKGKKISIGHGEDEHLSRAIRVHGNFSEYVPLALILCGFVETARANAFLVHLIAGTLLAGRVFHVLGLRTAEADFRFRVGGMILTFVSIIVSSGVILWFWIFQNVAVAN